MRILDFSDGFESSVEPTSVALPASMVSVTPSGNISSTNAQAALVELQGDINTINNKIGAVSGIASLDSDGKVPSSQIPPIALVDVYSVADITARDALTVQEGDVAQVADAGSGVSKAYIYNGSSWLELVADGSLNAHMADTSTHGVSGAIVGTTDTQTLTNKTIDADSNTVSNIDNDNIKSGANIAVAKLAALTASRALETSAGGVIQPSAVTSTELGHLSGVTSNLQDQIDGLSAGSFPFEVAKYKWSTSSATASSTAFAHNVFTIIDYDTMVFEKTDFVTTGSNWKFQPTVAGYYHVKASIQLQGNPSTDAYVRLFKNGTADQYLIQKTSAETTGSLEPAGALVYLNGSTDYIDMRIYHRNGGTALGVNDYGAGTNQFVNFIWIAYEGN